jgi:hypothetical protein
VAVVGSTWDVGRAHISHSPLQLQIAAQAIGTAHCAKRKLRKGRCSDVALSYPAATAVLESASTPNQCPSAIRIKLGRSLATFATPGRDYMLLQSVAARKGDGYLVVCTAGTYIFIATSDLQVSLPVVVAAPQL